MDGTIRIAGWLHHFEVSQSKKVKGGLSWVAVPTKHDGKGFRRIMRLNNGAAIYGAWILLLGVAAKCPERGVLADEQGPLSLEDLELKTGCPQAVLEEAIKHLSDKSIGWLEVGDSTVVECGGTESEPRAPTGQYSTGQNKTEQETTNVVCPTTSPSALAGPAVLTFPVDGKGSREWMLTQEKLREYQEAYPTLDVLAEFRRALQWVKSSPENRKTAGGMLRFLTRWLNRSTNGRSGTRSSGGARPAITKPEGF